MLIRTACLASMGNGKNKGLGVRSPRRWSQLYYVQISGPWTNNITSLCLSFLVCKLGRRLSFVLLLRAILGGEGDCWLGGGPAHSCQAGGFSCFCISCSPAPALRVRKGVSGLCSLSCGSLDSQSVNTFITHFMPLVVTL